MIVDTTYLLSLTRIHVDTDLLKAIVEGKTDLKLDNLTVNLTSTFELQAKSTKMRVPAKFVTEAVETILATFKVEPFHKPEITKTSFKLRKKIKDYINCVTVATAVTSNEDVATEDTLILDNKQQIKNLYRVNVLSYKDLVRNV
ncbi:MAG: hypothetical protein U9O89_05105 [Thermoproteota archaeon]|nr:hypothetical protein [Thermoproteota archaeon]